MGKTDGGGMWHEARKQEKKIRVMMVDHKRRADRRRQFYEQIKQDPTQFVRVYGRPYKIHLEHSVALAAEGPQTMMPWRGNEDIIIDRFDVRSHLDLYVEPNESQQEQTESEKFEERSCNYERFRILVQNDIAGVSEDMCLRQIHLDELYGAIENKKSKEDKKKNADKKAAIGFTYEDSTDTVKANKEKEEQKNDENLSEDSDFEEIDLDNTIDIHNLTLDEVVLLNQGSLQYGMDGNDFYDHLELDKDEAEALRLAKIMEEEKAQFSGRKSRRERRAFKEKRLKDRPNSPPAYAARESPKYEPFNKERSASRSKSRSPDHPERFSFITSFGGDCDDGVIQGPTLPPHLLPKGVRNKLVMTRSRRSGSGSRSRSPSGRGQQSTKARIGHLKLLKDQISKSRSKSKSRSRSRSQNGSRSRSPYRRHGRYGRSRSRSQSRNCYHSRYSRSRSRGRRSRSRSRGWRSRSRSHNRRSGSIRRVRRSYSRSRSQGRRSRSRSQGRRSRSRRSRSRSRSRSGSSRSRSSSYSRSRSRSYSRSRSGSRSPAKPVLKSYRRPSLSSKGSDSESESDSNGKDRTSNVRTHSRSETSKHLGNKDPYNKSAKATLAEKMKLKMQKALKRQFKADTKERQEKEVKALQKQQDREDELRAIAIQMRRREREKRHRDIPDTPVMLEIRRSKSRSRSKSRRRSRSHHRSRSPNRDRKERESHGDWKELQRRQTKETRSDWDDQQRRSRRDSRDDMDDLQRRPSRDNRSGNWEVLQRRCSREQDSWNDQRSSKDSRRSRYSRDGRDSRDIRDGSGSRHQSSSHHKTESLVRGRNLPKLVDY